MLYMFCNTLPQLAVIDVTDNSLRSMRMEGERLRETEVRGI